MCYLEHMKVGNLIYLVLPCLMEDAYSTLVAELEHFRDLLAPEVLAKRAPMLLDLICKYSRDFWSVSQANSKSVAGPKWKFAIHEIRQLENSVTRIKSLCEKLNVRVDEEEEEVDAQVQLLVRGLMSGRPTVVSGGPANEKAKEILQLFSQAHEAEGDVVSTQDGEGVRDATRLIQWDLLNFQSSAETEREFVFRMDKKVAAGDDVILPQFMRVLLKPNSNEYRICGAFAQHVNIVYD